MKARLPSGSISEPSCPRPISSTLAARERAEDVLLTNREYFATPLRSTSYVLIDDGPPANQTSVSFVLILLAPGASRCGASILATVSTGGHNGPGDQVAVGGQGLFHGRSRNAR